MTPDTLALPEGARVRLRRVKAQPLAKRLCRGCHRPATHALEIHLPIDPNADCFAALDQAEPVACPVCRSCGRAVADALRETIGGAS